MDTLKLIKLFDGINHLKGAKNENALANEIAINLRNLSLDGKLKCVWFHVPNEYVVANCLDKARIRKRQCQGMIAGAPDLIFAQGIEDLDGNKFYSVMFIELKTETGRLSDKQKLFKEWTENSGIPYIIAKSWNDVYNALIQRHFINI